MSILRNGNSMSVALQQDLAQYGLDRQRAIEGVRELPNGLPKYFGVSHKDGKTVMSFPTDITELDNKYGMDIAMVAPNNTETFNMLEPAFGERLSMKEPHTVRNYLRKLLESI